MKSLYLKYQKVLRKEAKKRAAGMNLRTQSLENLYIEAFEKSGKYLLDELVPQLLMEYAELVNRKVDPEMLVEEFYKRQSEE